MQYSYTPTLFFKAQKVNKKNNINVKIAHVHLLLNNKRFFLKKATLILKFQEKHTKT